MCLSYCIAVNMYNHLYYIEKYPKLFWYEYFVYLHLLNKVKSLYRVSFSEFILPRYHIYVLPYCLKTIQERMASVLGVQAYHSHSYYECWHDSQPVSVCPKFLANLIPSIQVIPEQHTAYHTLTIFHTGDKLKLGRQIAWKLVALWKHISSLVVFTVKFWWHFYGQVWWS